MEQCANNTYQHFCFYCIFVLFMGLEYILLYVAILCLFPVFMLVFLSRLNVFVALCPQDKFPLGDNEVYF